MHSVCQVYRSGKDETHKIVYVLTFRKFPISSKPKYLKSNENSNVGYAYTQPLEIWNRKKLGFGVKFDTSSTIFSCLRLEAKLNRHPWNRNLEVCDGPEKIKTVDNIEERIQNIIEPFYWI